MTEMKKMPGPLGVIFWTYSVFCALMIYYAEHSSVSATVLRKLLRHFSQRLSAI